MYPKGLWLSRRQAKDAELKVPSLEFDLQVLLGNWLHNIMWTMNYLHGKLKVHQLINPAVYF